MNYIDSSVQLLQTHSHSHIAIKLYSCIYHINRFKVIYDSVASMCMGCITTN